MKLGKWINLIGKGGKGNRKVKAIVGDYGFDYF